MTFSGFGLLISILVCVVAVLGMRYFASKDYDNSSDERRDLASLIFMLILGLGLLAFAMSGQLDDPDYADRTMRSWKSSPAYRAQHYGH